MGDFANPEILKTLSIGEKLINSLSVTVLGMTITFLILVILMFSIKLLSKVANRTVSTKLVEDDTELVAVITAAINEYNEGDENLVVSSYKEI